MKNMSLATQISVIFIAAFLLTSLLMGVFITRSLENLYENTIYEHLEAEGKAIRMAFRISSYETEDDIAYIRYNETENYYYASENMMEYIDEEAVDLLLGKALAQSTYQERYTNTINEEQIYYVIINYQGVMGYSEDIYIVIADSSMKYEMIYDTRRQIYLICLVAFSLGYVIILLWATKLIDETKRISVSLKKVGENHYRSKVETLRKDEMGDLVDNIESMRLRIIENEQFRQEVIQGSSHDFKTPIALISSYTEAFEDGMCQPDELVKVVKKETKRLNTKVTQLLNLTRLGYVNANITQMGSTQMRPLLEDLAGVYSYQNKIQIVTDLKDATFTGDRESWIIACQNILDNAMRYAESEIKIKLRSKSLVISNDGKSIDEKFMPKLFDPYEKGADGKSGLGLSIVSRTADILGYSVKAKNLSRGVSFIIEEMPKNS